MSPHHFTTPSSSKSQDSEEAQFRQVLLALAQDLDERCRLRRERSEPTSHLKRSLRLVLDRLAATDGVAGG